MGETLSLLRKFLRAERSLAPAPRNDVLNLVELFGAIKRSRERGNLLLK